MRTALSMMALSAILLTSFASPARADDDEDAEVTRMAKEHYKAGLEAYKTGRYNVAIKELQKAYLLKRLPALLLNIGATYRKMGEYDNAIHYYQKFLDEAAADARERPEVQGIIAEIQKDKSAPPPPPPSSETTPPPPQPTREEAPTPRDQLPKTWSHTPIDAAPPEQPIDVRVAMPTMKGVKVYVFYRTAGQSDFAQVLMKRRGPEKVGRIPGEGVTGKALQYFIEARDPGGNLVKSSGSKDNPNIVMLDPAAPPQVLASVDTSVQPGEPGRTEEQPGRNLDEEAPTAGGRQGRPVTRRSSGGGGRFSTLFWAGVGVAAFGVVSLAGGIAGLAVANDKANSIGAASRNPFDSTMTPIFFNNDPNAMGFPQYASEQDAGKLANQVGIAFTVIGSLALVAGGAVTIVGLRSGASKPERPRASTAPAAVESWYITPTVGPRVSGAVAGLSF